MNGNEISYKYKRLRLNGRGNYICALMMVNEAINKRLGKDRKNCSLEEFKDVLDNLDEILTPLQRKLRKVKADYEKEET